VVLSVLEKATQLQGEARRLDAGAKSEADALRVTSRIEEVRNALDKLGRQIEIALALKQQAPTADVSLQGLDDGLANLAAKGSLPSDRAFLVARGKAEETTIRLSQEIRQAWTNWTAERLDSLPLDAISRLGPDDRTEAESVLAELRRATPSSSLGPGLFADKCERLGRLLEQAPEAPEQVAVLLDRLPCTLSEMTDADIALLREHGLDRAIELQRKEG
jgi:hypothetical protein